MTKKVLKTLHNSSRHWVGDGFPVRTLFSYNAQGTEISPFLLLDFAGPTIFPASSQVRGVGQHPHRGFETVTIVHEGEVAHRDSTGQGGTIGPGDVQWMTAGSGILHEEFHSPTFARNGGPFRMIQLWVNLPAKHKMAAPGYQAIQAKDIPVVPLADGKSRVRVIAGEFQHTRGPARTFTPLNVWDVRLEGAGQATFELPEGHMAAIVVIAGQIAVNESSPVGEADTVLLEREGSDATITSVGDAQLLILTGEPLEEPIAGYGPFVMNTGAEIQQAIADLNNGRFGQIDADVQRVPASH